MGWGRGTEGRLQEWERGAGRRGQGCWRHFPKDF